MFAQSDFSGHISKRIARFFISRHATRRCVRLNDELQAKSNKQVNKSRGILIMKDYFHDTDITESQILRL